MAALELHDTDGPVLRDNIFKAIDGLELPHQKVQVPQMLSDDDLCNIRVTLDSIWQVTSIDGN